MKQKQMNGLKKPRLPNKLNQEAYRMMGFLGLHSLKFMNKNNL